MRSLSRVTFLTFAHVVAAGCGGRLALSAADAGDECEDLGCVDGPLDPFADAGAYPGADARADARPDDRADADIPDSRSDGGLCANGPGARFATSVVSHHFGTGQNFNQATAFPGAIFGPPEAGNTASVVSLGNGGWVVLAFANNAIVDGPGPDFTVFENPLPVFKELATVAVSEDGTTWHEFPCTAPRTASDFGYCAGVEVVRSSSLNSIDPLDPTVSGGDTYDLADIGVTRARFVRIVDRADIEGADGVFDLDAVAIVNAECP